MRRGLSLLLCLTLSLAQAPAWAALKTTPTLPVLPALPSAPAVPPLPAVPASLPAASPGLPTLQAPETPLQRSVEAVAEAAAAPAADQHGLGEELAAALQNEDFSLLRRQDGRWELVRADKGGQGKVLLSALRTLDANGTDLPGSSEIITAPQPKVEALRTASLDRPRLILGAESLRQLSAPALAAGGKRQDGVVQALVIMSLTLGLPAPMRLGAEELLKLGFIVNPAMSAAEAVRLYKEHRLDHFDRLLARLRREFPHQETLSTAWPYERAPHLHLDPAARVLISVTGTGHVRVRTAAPDGRLGTEVAQDLPLGPTVMGTAYEPASRTLRLFGHFLDGSTMKTLVLSASGRFEAPAAAAKEPALSLFHQLLGLDEAMGLAVFLNLRSLDFHRLRPDGTPEAQPFRSVPAGLDWRPNSAVFDREARTVIVAGAQRVVVFKPDQAEPFQLMPRAGASGHSYVQAAFDPAGRMLYISGGPAGAIEALAVLPDGEIDPDPLLALPLREDHVSALVLDPAAKSLLVGTQRYIFRYHAEPQELPEPYLSREAALDVLAARLAGADAKGAEEVAEVLRSAVASDLGGLAWVHGLWERLTRGLLKARRPAGGLRKLRPLWHRGAQEELARRMPELLDLLASPARVAALLDALGLLRMALPYHVGIGLSDPAAGAAWKEALRFKLGRLEVSPVTHSFRRHLVTARGEGDQEPFSVELKVPGQEKGREMIFRSHFDAAAELWEDSPEDPGVVEPLVFGRYAGRLRMYGKSLRYDPANPLGVMVFRHEDGPRLRHVGQRVNELAALAGKDAASYIRDARADAAAAAIRLHRLGWKGATGGGNDMHDENVRVTRSGRGVLVGDFGAFEKAPLPPLERALETLMLVGLSPGMHRALLEELVPLVVERLARGAADDAAREALRQEVLVELGLKAPPKTP